LKTNHLATLYVTPFRLINSLRKTFFAVIRCVPAAGQLL
jgi:hypothetical protein